MKRKLIAALLALSMIATGCGAGGSAPSVDNEADIQEAAETENPAETEQETGDNSGAAASIDRAKAARESLLGSWEETYYDKDLVPSVAPYKVADDFSNVVYADRFCYWLDPQYENEYSNITDLRDHLIKYNFAVDHNYSDSEFFEVYEGNRYSQFPSFITVDSLMHTYHLYFAHLMKTCEKDYIASALAGLGETMLNDAKERYEALKGTEWENAALRNLEFFAIGTSLQNDNVQMPAAGGDFENVVKTETARIMAAEGIDTCLLTGKYEDYSQYKPRGYYEGDEQLEKYFRAMMWYGRIPYAFEDEDMARSAVLMTSAIAEVGQEQWNSIYNITSFFAGAADDTTCLELAPILTQSYGKVPTTEDIKCDKDAFSKAYSIIAKLQPPAINSIPVEDGDNPVISSFRFMGQRFTIDAAIMQKLVYSAIKENSEGENRYLPDTLDAAAALGSEKAFQILEEKGETDYQGYTDNLKELQAQFNGSDESQWNASLYAGWLNTLRPLLEVKGEGYPSYMQSEEWVKKDLETFAGSYAELKHDTILYAKQVMAEMGDGDDEEVLDDRGYVDPEPVVYSRFAFLSGKTKEGLAAYNMLSDTASDDLDRLKEIALTLLSISEKELKNEERTEEDYNFIREYGGYLEHFWYEAMKDSVEDLVYSYQAPCPVIADIATDPNGTCLEVGSGQADTMYVIFPMGDELHVGRGSVYTFYQFEQPIGDRLTDQEWRNMLNGGYLDDDWNWIENDNKPQLPDWTTSYRVNY